jgi:DUF4097 and DUF4098 domain-containing protein YvlB
VIAVVGAAVSLVCGCGIGGSSFGYADSTVQSFEIQDNVTSLHVKTSGGNIEVDGSARSTVQVTGTLHYNGPKPTIEHSVNGGDLVLNDPGCATTRCHLDIRLEVPTAVAVHLTSGGSDITVRGVSGSVDATTGGGSLHGDGLGAKNLTARSGGGDVDVAFSAAPDHVNAKTGGGSVTVKVPGGSYDVNVDPRGGSQTIKVRVDSGSSHQIVADSGGGDISVVPAG